MPAGSHPEGCAIQAGPICPNQQTVESLHYVRKHFESANKKARLMESRALLESNRADRGLVFATGAIAIGAKSLSSDNVPA